MILNFCFLQNTKDNPIHIINVSIKTADTEDDDVLVTALTSFAQSKVCYNIFCKLAKVLLLTCLSLNHVLWCHTYRKLPSLNMVSEE